MQGVYTIGMKTLLNWLLGKPKNPYFTGVLPDNRTQAQIDQDYLHTELVGTPVATGPFNNTQLVDSPYPYQNQQGTSECVPHAVGLAYEIERGVTLYVPPSPTFVYRLRSNYPGEGSIIPNIYDIYHNTGAPLYSDLPTPATEAEANSVVLTPAMYNEAAIYKGANYFKISPSNDISTIATVAQQGHGVTICFYSTYEEWSQLYPQIVNPTLKQSDPTAQVSHEVCVLPNSGFILNGTRYVVIQDSAWFGGIKLRYVSEAFIAARITDARYWIGTLALGSGPVPKYHFTQSLTVGSKGNEVVQMQKLLISEGLLPNDCATGNFAGLTLAGVKAFQQKYAADILLPQGLSAPTGYWGAGSIKKANILCA